MGDCFYFKANTFTRCDKGVPEDAMEINLMELGLSIGSEYLLSNSEISNVDDQMIVSSISIGGMFTRDYSVKETPPYRVLIQREARAYKKGNIMYFKGGLSIL